ncbi:MAG: DUF3160 domain-containing protein [Verrucomicrobiales bacterium]
MATGVRLPKWTGTPAVKTFHLQQSSDLKNWASIGPAVTFEQVDPSLPLQFPLPPSDGTQFYRLNEKLTFRFENSLTAESASFSAQFDGFLEEFEDLSIDGFRELYSPFAPTEFSTLVDPYLEDLTFDPTQAPFWKEFNTSPEDHNAQLPVDDPERRLHDFRLNEGELSLFRKNGFVVSERLQRKTFVDMFYDIWTDDLPVFISSDAMLQAWHRTYVSMLEETEEVFLRPALRSRSRRHEIVRGAGDTWCSRAVTGADSVRPLRRTGNIQFADPAGVSTHRTDHFRTVAEKLGDVALTQLDRKPISEEQHSFIRSLVEAEEDVYLGIRLYSGWYPNLYYQNAFPGVAEHPSAVWDPLVTDVHTDAPDDCHGDDGGILHEAVGNVNFLLMAANHGDAQCVIGGPVFSHYEFILPIERGRMTDAEWKSNPSAPVSDFVKEFLVPAQP